MVQGELSQWRERARCNANDPAVTKLFFSDDKESEARAKAICATCEVWRPCLKYAVQNGEKHGVWGGRSYKERTGLSAYQSVIAVGIVHQAPEPEPLRFTFGSVFQFTFASQLSMPA